MSGALGDQRTQPKSKGSIHKMIIRPAMHAISDGNCNGPPRKKKRLGVVKMKMRRLVCRFIRKDHVTNDEIRDLMKIENIRTR